MAGESGSIQSDVAWAPQTVQAFDAAVGTLPGGRFFEEAIRERSRPYLACFYGGPFYAISKLAPDLFKQPQIKVVFGGALTILADEGGRWLSLFRKALPYGGKISCTFCTTTKPRFGRAPRQLLVQPPQIVVAKTWLRYLREAGDEPDILVLYPPGTFGEYKAFIDELSNVNPSCRVLIACRARVDVLIMHRLLKMSGFTVSEPLGFPNAESEVHALATGAWWLSVGSRQGSIQPPEESDLERLRYMHRAFRDAVDEASDYDHATAIATAYGRRASIHIGSIQVPDAMLVSDVAGIDLASGQWFRRSDATIEGDEGTYKYDGSAIPATILGLLPQIKSNEAALDFEFRLLTWLTRAADQEEDAAASVLDEDLDSATPVQIEGPTSEANRVAQASPVLKTSPIGHPPADVEPAAESVSTTARLRLPRSRLSRSAGTVNVLGVAARLGHVSGTGEQGYGDAQARILKWVANKGFGNVPADTNYHIETHDGEVTVETDGKQVWALRFDDRKQMEGGAFWRVELALIRALQPAIGLRLYQVRRSEEAPAPVSGVPKVLAVLANEVGLSDYGIPLLPRAVRLTGRSGAEQLFDLLLNKDRVQPLIVISPSRGIIPDTSMDRLAERLVGAAHVVLIDSHISDAMIRQFGRERSVFGSAIRLYRPGFKADSDPFQHRVWAYSGSHFSPYQTNDIAEEVCAISLEGGDFENRVPSFVAIRNQVGQVRLKELRRQAEKVAATVEEERARQLEIQKSLEKDLEQAREWAKELETRNEQVEMEIKTVIGERDEALEQVRRLRHRLNIQLEPQYGSDDEGSDGSPWYPDTWELLEEWADSYGDGKLILLPSAIKAAKESAFHIELSYRALELLAKYYVPMRQRKADDDEPWRKFNQALSELGLECSPTGDATEHHRYKKDYQRLYEGRTITLDMHLKRGNGFDPEGVFRVYFFYDDQAGKVIIGHLPSHLTNSKTH